MQSEHLLACEQAPKWGKEKSASQVSGELWGEEERKLIPHLRACSQAKHLLTASLYVTHDQYFQE